MYCYSAGTDSDEAAKTCWCGSLAGQHCLMLWSLISFGVNTRAPICTPGICCPDFCSDGALTAYWRQLSDHPLHFHVLRHEHIIREVSGEKATSTTIAGW